MLFKDEELHWSVIGPRFSELHKFFKEQHEALDGIVDESARRAKQFGVFDSIEAPADFGHKL